MTDFFHSTTEKGAGKPGRILSDERVEEISARIARRVYERVTEHLKQAVSGAALLAALALLLSACSRKAVSVERAASDTLRTERADTLVRLSELARTDTLVIRDTLYIAERVTQTVDTAGRVIKTEVERERRQSVSRDARTHVENSQASRQAEHKAAEHKAATEEKRTETERPSFMQRMKACLWPLIVGGIIAVTALYYFTYSKRA